jgi:chemotaxis protein methyltransferase CheR
MERFRAIVARRLGLSFEDHRVPAIAALIGRRATATGGVDAWLARLEDARDEELRALIPQLTVGETYFFRNPDQFRALVGEALPARLRDKPPGEPLRILSAGCASGEEPYSIAIAAAGATPPGRPISIVAIDVNPAAIEKARRARYSTWALRETSSDQRARWFRADGAEHALDPAVAAMVSFEERNLVDDDPSFWQPRSFDVVF